ncbi:hypothetical protein [Rubellicoccus peritrichatus]|uniref:Lipoprotein n=1 Tax=Rubellicoccus peritrichatus TaxID=3080537 RepID=A0AAQ3QUF2_9BACT|nr:hypothetical protein [Puniceicoccus sp. CR14]WOO42316.1 hypothetical protein RZN69_04385 [Puniceicoccus sp. CR14]
MKKPFIILFCLLSLPVFVMLSGCKTMQGADSVTEYNNSPLTVPVPSGLSEQQVGDAMASVLRGREWNVIESSPNRAVGTLDHRGFRARAILERSGNTIRILSDSTSKSLRTGEYEPAVPLGWLQNLQSDLRKKFQEKDYGSY